MTKPGRPGGRKTKKGPSAGSGGNGRRALEGKGPTPKAEDRSWHVAGKRKAAQDRLDPKSHRRLGALIYKTESGDFRLLLRMRLERPRNRRATKKPDKFPPPHAAPPRLSMKHRIRSN